MAGDYPPESAYPMPEPGPRSPISRVPGSHQIGWGIWILLLLLTMFIAPSIVEKISYSYKRGEQRAAAEIAREELKTSPITIASYPSVVKAVFPSVVGVEVTQIVEGPPDEFFGLRPRMKERGQGSGVIVDEAGYIITNDHVVGRAKQVSVQLSTGQSVPAKVIGTDLRTDLAVLQIHVSDKLEATPLGDSDKLEVGDAVLAVGNPYGLAGTVTAGIISAIGRQGILNYEVLQTDAAVNPGNSGGPLVNMKGQVIGINTAIVGSAYQGISFAIPSNRVKQVFEKLKTGQTIEYGWLGVATNEVTPELANELKLEDTNGALVSGVIPGSPAAAAGIKPRDVIVRWNNKPITDSHQLGPVVADTPVGSEATVIVKRKGKDTKLTVTVGKRP
jgi:serine protease Do